MQYTLITRRRNSISSRIHIYACRRSVACGRRIHIYCSEAQYDLCSSNTYILLRGAVVVVEYTYIAQRRSMTCVRPINIYCSEAHSRNAYVLLEVINILDYEEARISCVLHVRGPLFDGK